MALIDPYKDYLAAGVSFSPLSETATPQLAYGVFGEDRRPLLPFIDTGLIYCGDLTLFKYFYRVRFGGSGKLYVRAMVENTEVQRGSVVLSEDPYQASIFRLPRGCAGYGLRLQLVGLAWMRYFAIEWDPVGGVE